MAKKPKFDPALHDENPEWTKEDFAKAKPASAMPDKMLNFFKTTKAKLGRPPAEIKKVPVKLRLDPEVVDALRASGPGWQTRINAMLASRIKNGKVSFHRDGEAGIVAAKTLPQGKSKSPVDGPKQRAKGQSAEKRTKTADRNGRKRT